MKRILNIRYSKEDPDIRQLDVFLPDGDGNGRCIFFIHGGGWRGGKRSQWHATAEHFCRLGYVCASCSYHFAPKWTFPKQFEDVRLALSFVKERADEYGFRIDRIASWGSSSGGHLAAMLATVQPEDDLGMTEEVKVRDTLVNAAVCLCSIFSLHRKDGYHSTDFLGTTEEGNPELVRIGSPIDRLCGKEPPFLLVVGDADTTTPVFMDEQMRDAILARGGTVELEILPGVKHGYGYGVATDAQKRTVELAESFLDRVWK